MYEDRLSPSDKTLLILHNLCATHQDMAKRSDELAQVLQRDINEVNQILSKHEADGYVRSLVDNEGNRRYYLTNVGIIRVCSIFT
ncbi:MAG: hypothetical protein QW146_07995 [Candidatus Bathyarchaeia archaeon]